jgi:hypothetical protein
MENNNKELKISAENALKAYNATDDNGKELLEHLFGREVFAPKNIMERVKTFEDAVKVLGDNNASVNQYLFVANGPEMDETGKDLLAYLKLRIIAEALNEGWKPKFDGEERRWYPYFYIYTKEEYDRLDEDDKKNCRVVGRAYYSAYVGGGVVCANANHAWSHSYAAFGSRLAFRTEELAEYCGKQFIDIWMDFLIG